MPDHRCLDRNARVLGVCSRVVEVGAAWLKSVLTWTVNENAFAVLGGYEVTVVRSQRALETTQPDLSKEGRLVGLVGLVRSTHRPGAYSDARPNSHQMGARRCSRASCASCEELQTMGSNLAAYIMIVIVDGAGLWFSVSRRHGLRLAAAAEVVVVALQPSLIPD